MCRKLIDSNIWVAHEMGYPDVVFYIRELIKSEQSLVINTVIEMELMSHYEIETNPIVKQIREDYVYKMIDEIIDITSPIAMKAGEIRRKAKLFGRRVPKEPDALIAATAIVHRIPLVSNNDKDFKWISEYFDFPLINPITNHTDFQEFQQMYKRKRENM